VVGVWERVLEVIASFLWLVECKLWLPKKKYFVPSIDYQKIITQMPYIQEQSILV